MQLCQIQESDKCDYIVATTRRYGAWGVVGGGGRAGDPGGVYTQQETRLEDPTTEYYVTLIRTLLANTTQSLQDTLTRLSDSAAKEATLKDLWDSLRDVKESVGSLERSIEGIRSSVDNGVDRTRVEIRMFRDRVSEELADLRNLLEDKTKDESHQMAEMLATDCQDLYDLGFNATGVYHLPKHGRDVLCEMEGGDGGWLVVQRRVRVADQVNFDRDWDAYKKGFGDVETEFWIGNDFLHVLTNQKSYQLHIDIHDYEKGPYWTAYNTDSLITYLIVLISIHHSVGTGLDYALIAFSGNTTDAFTYHHGRSFSTSDRDNDLYADGNCAEQFTGGWWYDRCYDAHLNGVFPAVPDRQNASYLTWWAQDEGKRVPLVLDKVTMRIKPSPV
ncbi:Techylectin-5B [Chionoecetes opilio]|uniref:Techylectin-5B n=1 Tax=Chionoecetes opilio TaxID=41210 RepID=A0A8J5CU26_CHIOP|nr:Techylectin-5B [Chionoecetes opilio]